MPNSALCKRVHAFLYRHYCNIIRFSILNVYFTRLLFQNSRHFITYFLRSHTALKQTRQKSQQLNLIKENVAQLFTALRLFLLFTFLVLVPYCHDSCIKKNMKTIVPKWDKNHVGIILSGSDDDTSQLNSLPLWSSSSFWCVKTNIINAILRFGGKIVTGLQAGFYDITT